MAKVKRANSEYERLSGRTSYYFKCPGCGDDHAYITENLKPERPCPVWKFNGDLERPTFQPSLIQTGGPHDKREICHFFITNGQIQFLGDCTHDLAGRTMDLPEVE